MEESQVELHSRASVVGAAGASAIRRIGKTKYATMLGKHRIAKEGWSSVAMQDLTVQPVPRIEAGKPAIYSEVAPRALPSDEL